MEANDLREYPQVLDVLNEIVFRKGIAEVKIEHRRDGDEIIVVEITRKVKTK